METRANHVWVGAVTLFLLAALAAFIMWIAGLSGAQKKEYDIFFKQSVDGLARGSNVTFSGVPVGEISEIELWPRNPEYVRVRIRVGKDVPILVGTVATVQSSFTGSSKVQLDGAREGAPEITCQNTSCLEGKPTIAAKPGGLGEILSNAPLLLERLATLTDRLTQLLSDDNQASIAGILKNTERLTDHVADASPQIQATLTELQATLRQASGSLAAFEKTMGTADGLLKKDGEQLAGQLRDTLKSAKLAAESLDTTLKTAQPATRQLSETTLPAAEATLRDLREASAALRKITEKIDNQGAGALLKGNDLPDYKP
ncbi:MAG: mammalian cell entry protein [Sphingomonadales bacterium 63-6]|nr:MAG: mammalian cell entry protein [Sphingomonadales bacterium 63-6]